MSEGKIYSDISVVLFSISLSWAVNERISSFPKIRRFGAILKSYKLLCCDITDEYKQTLCSDLLVLTLSWVPLMLFTWASTWLIVQYNDSMNNYSGDMCIKCYILPFLFFLIPQFISRLISSLVLWLCKYEVRKLWENDRQVFDIFSSSWRKSHHLNYYGIVTGYVHKKAKYRTTTSFIFLALLLIPIFILTGGWVRLLGWLGLG